MKVQFQASRDGVYSMRFAAPLQLARRAGELRVREGAVWLTRRNDLQDHLLQPGERVRLGAGDAAVIEPWRRQQTVLVDWQPAGVLPAAARLLRAAAGRGLGSLAAGATALGRALRRAQEGVAGRAN